MMEEVFEPSPCNEEEQAHHPLLQSTSSINYDPPQSSELKLYRMRPRIPKNISKCRIIKNLTVMSFSLFIFFLGFQALANLQSTMNSAKGLGMDSQAAIYASSMISALLLPDLMIKRFGCKRTLVSMIICSIPFIAANFYPTWETLMPSSVLIGFAAGPLSTSQALYINEMSLHYHKQSLSASLESVMARFYGTFYFFSENTQIWGNLISYYVLRPGMVPIRNHSIIPCGIDFHKYGSGNNTNPNLQPPTEEKRFLLVGIYVACGLLSCLLLGYFVDPLDNDKDTDETSNKCEYVIDRLLSAVKQTTVPDQMLLLPLTVFCGMQTAFYTSDFTQAYIACSWGIHHVGFVTICFGVCGAIMAVLVGPLVRCISQMSVLILAACINVTTCGLLYVWEPTPDNVTTYFVFAGVWGMADAIWWSQITALYGLMFPNDREAAFSNFFFWSFLGFFLCYSYANYFSVALKLGILLFFLVTGIICYLIGQIKIKRSPRREYIVIEDE
ncbi:protein unc-93 homolog A-like isoform X1 [Stegodyphus dumicola]|uniref:protein unc-93 homolog A-like isoform X1 n=1 Tax=Stegodyphus dumicola TaxID=202533 RepID=UPI0015ACDF14|nr:protein unc-93 homolog A-like isoform X1 [Stegodyphus dumicola]